MNTGKKPYTVGRNTVSVGRILDGDETYESFLDSYSVYYNLKREGTDDPFLAEAVFDSKSEQYFLIRAAKVAEMRSVEYVYFARESDLDAARLKVLDEKAWERGIARVEPGPNHKNTDVCLIVLADKLTDDARQLAVTSSHSKNYRLALHGYSNFRLIVIELSSGTAYLNRQARILKELVGNIMSKPFSNEREIMK